MEEKNNRTKNNKIYASELDFDVVRRHMSHHHHEHYDGLRKRPGRISPVKTVILKRGGGAEVRGVSSTSEQATRSQVAGGFLRHSWVHDSSYTQESKIECECSKQLPSNQQPKSRNQKPASSSSYKSFTLKYSMVQTLCY